MARLAVNVDHVANLREARKIDIPDPVDAAVLAELAGAHGIVVHLREDRRHIQERDVEILRRVVKSKLNLEMAVTEEMVRFACRIKPDISTLVPERRREITTEGGLDVKHHLKEITKAIDTLRASGIRVSAFIDPEIEQIEAAVDAGAEIVEIHTGRYVEAKMQDERIAELEKIRKAAIFALSKGLRVSAGHGLDYRNVKPVAEIKEIEEMSIGHSIVARAIMVGMLEAVRQMLALIS